MRKDGTRLKKIDPMYTIAAHIMDKRYDSMNMITLDIPLNPIQEYLNKKRNEGYTISHLALIIATYIRVVSEFPELNRFFVNKRPYARNELSVAMVVLKAGQVEHGTMSKCYFDYDNTVFEVNDIINKFVDENRNTPDDNKTEKIIKLLLKIPALLSFFVKLAKWADKHGLLPKSVIDASPFHNSLVISNLASIRTNHIYHHCYDFGTTSIIITVGNTREVPKRKGNEIVFEKSMPLGIVMDERIASGSYFALAFRRMNHLFKHPEELEQRPEKIVRDPAIN